MRRDDLLTWAGNRTVSANEVAQINNKETIR
jgi:hypothetical protein